MVLTSKDGFEREANTVDPDKDALEDRLVGLYDKWAGDIASL